MIVIEWDVVMIDSNSVENGSSYWVSAGAEYDNEQNVWVGQASFMTIVETFVSDQCVYFFAFIVSFLTLCMFIIIGSNI